MSSDSNIFTFPSREEEGFKPAEDGDTGIPQVLSAFQDLKRMVENNEVESFVVVGTTKDGGSFGSIAGLLSRMRLVGMLEYVKIQIIAE
jgi:hypothetical protein